jgi:hypothetical protein
MAAWLRRVLFATGMPVVDTIDFLRPATAAMADTAGGEEGEEQEARESRQVWEQTTRPPNRFLSLPLFGAACQHQLIQTPPYSEKPLSLFTPDLVRFRTCAHIQFSPRPRWLP